MNSFIWWLFKLLLGLAGKVPAKRELPVLIVEDCPEDAEIISHYVRMSGGHPVAVSTLEAAKDLLTAKKHRLIILDIQFTQGSGVELAKHYVRPKFPKLPIVFISGNIRELEKLPPGLCWTFIQKGSDSGSLLEAIQDAIAKANGINGQVPIGGVAIMVWLLMFASVLLGYFLKEVAPYVKHLIVK